jgi:hypothetical protein
MPYDVRHISPPLLCSALHYVCIIKYLHSPFSDNHKPASIDPTKPGTLEVNSGKEVTSVRVERPTVNVRFRFPSPTHTLSLTPFSFLRSPSPHR